MWAKFIYAIDLRHIIHAISGIDVHCTVILKENSVAENIHR